MKLLVTGASGFLGQAVVRSAAAAGHEVVAMVRPTANPDWPESVRILRGDLRQRGDWTGQLGDIEAVIHLAAAPTGDLATQFSGTVVATENLLDHLPLAALGRFVHVSSFSVYDFSSIGFGGALTETTPLEPTPERRDAYTTTKIAQEKLVTSVCEAAGTPLVVIRPGAIVGPGKDWGFGRVMKIGRFDLIFSPVAKFPFTYVDNCADAIVAALTAEVRSGSIFNIVDDDPPSYGRYHRLGRRLGGDAGVGLYMPWLFVSLLGRSIALFNRLAFDGKAKLPEFLAHRRQQVRWKPHRYPNRAARQGLGWSPRVPFEEAVKRTIGD